MSKSPRGLFPSKRSIILNSIFDYTISTTNYTKEYPLSVSNCVSSILKFRPPDSIHTSIKVKGERKEDGYHYTMVIRYKSELLLELTKSSAKPFDIANFRDYLYDSLQLPTSLKTRFFSALDKLQDDIELTLQNDRIHIRDALGEVVNVGRPTLHISSNFPMHLISDCKHYPDLIIGSLIYKSNGTSLEERNKYEKKLFWNMKYNATSLIANITNKIKTELHIWRTSKTDLTYQESNSFSKLVQYLSILSRLLKYFIKDTGSLELNKQANNMLETFLSLDHSSFPCQDLSAVLETLTKDSDNLDEITRKLNRSISQENDFAQRLRKQDEGSRIKELVRTRISDAKKKELKLRGYFWRWSKCKLSSIFESFAKSFIGHDSWQERLTSRQLTTIRRGNFEVLSQKTQFYACVRWKEFRVLIYYERIDVVQNHAEPLAGSPVLKSISLAEHKGFTNSGLPFLMGDCIILKRNSKNSMTGSLLYLCLRNAPDVRLKSDTHLHQQLLCARPSSHLLLILTNPVIISEKNLQLLEPHLRYCFLREQYFPVPSQPAVHLGALVPDFRELMGLAEGSIFAESEVMLISSNVLVLAIVVMFPNPPNPDSN